ncbi:MAG: hypothetical protein L0221_00355 [Chloroflexi bacterium]|nr:hypothetical protein [Chloroflexota bacterium]
MNLLGRFSYLSFLDLICCGFGGALLLFLIGASATPRDADAPTGSMILVRARHHDGEKAEVGIEFRRPGSRDWLRPATANGAAEGFSATAEAGSGSEAFLVLFIPEPGRWEFRPYLIDRRIAPAGARPTEVVLEVTGEGVIPPGDQKPVSMAESGRTGQIVSVFVRGAK